MSGFSLYKHGKYYYARLKNRETGEWTTAKSTGKTSRDDAAFIAMGWLHDKIPKGCTREYRPTADFFTVNTLITQLRKAPLTDSDIPKILDILKERGFIENARIKSDTRETFVNFLLNFWGPDSPYILDRKAHGKSVTQAHCSNNVSAVSNYWEPFFSDKILVDITRADIKDFSIWLSEQKKKKRINGEIVVFDEIISPSTRNNILKAGTVALKWATLEKLIPENPAEGISFFSGKNRKRGILTDKEVKKLFARGDWGQNPVNKLGNYAAMQTGLRMGELCSLRVIDVLQDRLRIDHSWSQVDGMKSTKTNESREVAIIPELANILLNHAKTTPHEYGPNSFIFYNANSPDKPHDGKLMYRAFKNALHSIGITETERASRNLTFHGWRHFYARHMVDVLDQRAADLTGHASPEMLPHYADHASAQDFEKAKQAVCQVFGKIVPFEIKKAVNG